MGLFQKVIGGGVGVLIAISSITTTFACDNGGCYSCLYNDWDEDLKVYTRDLCEEYDVEYSRVLAIIWNASRFDASATGYNSNGTKDYGLMQLNDVTFDFLNENIGIESMDELYNPETNILAGVTLLSYYEGITGDSDTALSMYQTGAGAYYEGYVHPSYDTVVNKTSQFEEVVKAEESNKLQETATKISEKVSVISALSIE